MKQVRLSDKVAYYIDKDQFPAIYLKRLGLLQSMSLWRRILESQLLARATDFVTFFASWFCLDNFKKGARWAAYKHLGYRV
jgi:hypothetical protein